MLFLRYSAIVIVLWSFVVLLIHLTKAETNGPPYLLWLFFSLMGLLAFILAIFAIRHANNRWQEAKANETNAFSKTNVEPNATNEEQKNEDNKEAETDQKHNRDEESEDKEEITIKKPEEDKTESVTLSEESEKQSESAETDNNITAEINNSTTKTDKDTQLAQKKQTLVKSLVKFCTENQHYKKHDDTPTTGDWFMGWLYVISIVFVVILICLILKAVKLYPNSFTLP